jgi:hypothetical protein
MVNQAVLSGAAAEERVAIGWWEKVEKGSALGTEEQVPRFSIEAVFPHQAPEDSGAIARRRGTRCSRYPPP